LLSFSALLLPPLHLYVESNELGNLTRIKDVADKREREKAEEGQLKTVYNMD
jgi:hypothetical protein